MGQYRRVSPDQARRYLAKLSPSTRRRLVTRVGAKAQAGCRNGAQAVMIAILGPIASICVISCVVAPVLRAILNQAGVGDPRVLSSILMGMILLSAPTFLVFAFYMLYHETRKAGEAAIAEWLDQHTHEGRLAECPACGYSTRGGASPECPECGTPVKLPPPPPAV